MSEVYVYGANLQGIHGAGTALEAKRRHGAVQGRIGRCGDSYGIATKVTPWKRMELRDIENQVQLFLAHADICPGDVFRVCAIGCGLAGYSAAEIAPMFLHAPGNVILPPQFLAVLHSGKR